MGGAHGGGAEALRLPGELGGALRRARGEPCHERDGSVRVAPLQAPRWSRRASRRLRCAPLRHGERREGLPGGHLRQALEARAKVMKFEQGYMISTGEPKKMFVDTCTRSVLMRQGVLGIKVNILKPYDPEGKSGPSKPMPDYVVIHEPKEDVVQREPNAAAAEY